MSSSKGWIKLHRDILEHWVYKDPLLLKLWITFLCMANHKDNQIPIDNQLITIHRGQFWTSFRKLADRTDMTPKTIRNKAKLLQSDGMIFVDARQGKGTLITVSNYAAYQAFFDDEGHTEDHTAGHTDDHNRETLRDTLTTYKQEVKNDRKCNKNEKKKGGASPGDPDYFEEV